MNIIKTIATRKEGDDLPAIKAVVESSEMLDEGNARIDVLINTEERTLPVSIELRGGIYPTPEKPLPGNGDIITIIPSKFGKGIFKEGNKIVADERAEVKIETKTQEEKEEVKEEPKPMPVTKQLTDNAIEWLSKRVELYQTVHSYIKQEHPDYPDEAIPPLATSLYIEFSRGGGPLYKTQGQVRRENKTEKEVGVKAQLSEPTKSTEKPAEPPKAPLELGKPWRDTLHPITKKPITEDVLKKCQMMKWALNPKTPSTLSDEVKKDFHRAVLDGLKEICGDPKFYVLQFIESSVIQETSKIREQQDLANSISQTLYEDGTLNDDLPYEKVFEIFEKVTKMLPSGKS
jgi:hypothetical protein